MLSFAVGLTLTAAPGQLRWQYSAGGRAVHSSPALGPEGMLYFGGNDYCLHALDARTGERRWTNRLSGYAIDASPAVDTNGTVYVVASDGSLFALAGATGNRIWQAHVGARAVSSPAIGPGGSLFVGSEAGRIFSFGASDGKLRWTFQTGSLWSSPSVGADGTVYVGTQDGKIYALDGATGLKRWECVTGAAVVASVAVAENGGIFIAAENGKVYALDGWSGSELWEFETGGSIWSSPAFGEIGTVYLGSDDGKFYALDGSTGRKLWERDFADVIWSSPAVAADGTVYVGGDNGWLYALNGTTGEEVWKFRTGGRVWSSPAIGTDGTVYVGTTSGIVFAVEGTSGLAGSAWPRFRANAAATGVLAHPPPTEAPRLLWQPEVVSPREGTNGFIALRWTGCPSCFRWYRDGEAIPGGTNAILSFTRAHRTNDGFYTLEASNRVGQTASKPVAVAVSNVDSEPVLELDWEAGGPSVFTVQWSDGLGSAAVWSGYLQSSTGSGPIAVPGILLNQPARFFRLQGWADSRINRLNQRTGIRLRGPVGSRYEVQFVTRTSGWTNWQTLTNLTLNSTPLLFVDPQSEWTTPRVYRINPLR